MLLYIILFSVLSISIHKNIAIDGRERHFHHIKLTPVIENEQFNQRCLNNFRGKAII